MTWMALVLESGSEELAHIHLMWQGPIGSV